MAPLFYSSSPHVRLPPGVKSPSFSAVLLTLYGAAALVLIAHSLFSVWTLYQPLPLDDHWDFVFDVQKWYDGTWGWADLWKQHNEHRLVIPRLFFLVDVLLFKGNSVFLVITNVAIQFLHVLLLWYVTARVGLPRRWRWAVAIAVPLFLLSAANLENLVWAFQTQFVLVFLAASVACVALLQSSAPPGLPWLALTIAMGCIATFSMANGVLLWPVLVLLALIGGLGWRTTLVVTIAGFCIGGLCLLSFTPHPGHASPFESVQHPLSALRYAALYLGGPFGHLFGHRVGIALGGVGMVLTASFAAEAIRYPRQLPTASLVLLGIAGFVVASAFATALGRMNFPPEQALSGRYLTPVLIYWAVTVASCLAQRPAPFWWRQPLFGVGLGLLTVLSAALIPLQRAEVRRWTVRTDEVKIGAAALLVNVQDDAAVEDVFPNPILAWLGAEVLRAHELSIYSEPSAALLGHLIGDTAQVAPPEDCSGAIDPTATVSIAPCQRGGFRVSGWLDSGKGAFSPEAIALVSETGKIVGLGAISLSTAPLPAKVRRRVSPWTGYVADRFQARQVVAYALSFNAHPTACRLSAETQAPPRTIPCTALPPRTIPFTALAAPLNGLGVTMTGGWSVNGQHPAGGAPPVNATVYGSWSGADGNTGTLRLGPFSAGDHKALGVPLVTGPSTTGLSAKLVDAGSGKILARLDSPALPAHQWVVWKIDLPAGAGSAQLLFILEDAGSAWGQWFAIAPPYGL